MKRILLTIAALAAAHAAHAGATVNTYTTLSSFNAAATTATTYNFNSIASSGQSQTNPAVLVTPAAGRVTFSVTGGTDANVYARSSTFSGGGSTLADGSDSVAAGLPTSGSFVSTATTIALGGSYTAFAIDFGMSNNATNGYNVDFFSGGSGGASASIAPVGGDNFFGATLSVSFDSVRFSPTASSSNYLVFDNARVGSIGASVVPEAGSLALLLPAFGGLAVGVARRRLRK